LVAQESGVVVTRGRKFSIGKVAGRNASEPACSLVNETEKPTLWSEGEGRWAYAETTEVAYIFSRGGRGGMLRKTTREVADTRHGDGEAID
jgi:hypothetical protein